jgi:cobalt-zinc-cadmium efflux system outer membrane protein
MAMHSLGLVMLAWTAFAQVEMAAPMQAGEPLPPVAPVVEPQAFTLDYVTTLALSNSPVLPAASAEISQARWQAMQAGLPPNPRVDSGNPQTIGGGQGVYTTGLTQPWIRGGKLSLDRAAGEQQAQRLTADFTRRRFEVLTVVRRQFFAVLAAQQRVAILGQMLQIARQSETTTENLLRAGQVGETDLLLLRIERRQAEMELQAAEALLLGAKRELAARIGLPFLGIDSVVGDLAIPLPSYDDAALVDQMLATNSQIRGAQIEISRSYTLRRRAEVEVVPNASLQGGVQYAVGPQLYQGLLGVYVDVPILNRNQGGIRAAEATISQAVAELSIKRNELTAELADALARYRAALRQIANYEEGILPDARRSLELIRASYERGQIELLRLVQTQRSLFTASLQFITAQESRLQAAADIAGLLQLDQFP